MDGRSVNIRVVAALFLLMAVFLAVPSRARCDDLRGLREVKVVWDLKVADEDLFEFRLDLIQQTADDLRRRKIRPVFVIALNGPAVKFAARSLAGTAAEGEQLEILPEIQELMTAMKKDGMVFILCGVSMRIGRVGRGNVLPIFDVVENVWVNITALQNKGYAYMALH